MLLSDPVLQLQDLHLCVQRPSLQGIDFDLQKGEIHAIVGERRSGKSSLLRLLGGEACKSSGKILLDNREIDFLTPESSFRQGIGIVHQTPNLVPSLTVIENIFLGRLHWRVVRPQYIPSLKARCGQMLPSSG